MPVAAAPIAPAPAKMGRLTSLSVNFGRAGAKSIPSREGSLIPLKSVPVTVVRASNFDMEPHLVLVLGAMLLACGSAGLLVLRLTNPRLSGIGWLGGSFAAGGSGAILLSFFERFPSSTEVVLADALVLSSFVLLHVAVLELDESVSIFPKFGVALLAIQVVTEFWLGHGDAAARMRDSIAGLFVAAQVGQTANRLMQLNRRAHRSPVRFTFGLLFLFMAFNLLRSLLDIFGGTAGWWFVQKSQGFVDAVFIAVALGIAFGFFWMTTAALTHDLELMASTDPLTRVFNRRYFLKWCEKEKERTSRTGLGFSILMVDIDHFKNINDRFGHAAGDAVICAVVEKMQDAIRGIDVIGRWGGEEFVVLLPAASGPGALVVAQRLRRNVEKIVLADILPVGLDNTHIAAVTVSVGVAGYEGVEDDLANVLERADRALYEAKARGRNQVAETA